MSIVKGHCPLPNSFIATVNSLSLTHREKNLLKVIGEEIYRFPEGRESLSKRLSSRYLESLTGIKRNHISVILNKFQSRGFIKYIKSHVKGQGSIIILTLGTVPVPENKELGTAIGHGDSKLGTVLVPNPITQNLKKDHQKEDSDSSLNSQEVDLTIEENPMENSLDSEPVIEEISTEESNLNMSAVNLLPAASTVKNEFSPLGSVLSAVPIPDINKTYSSLKDVDNNYSPSKDTYNTYTLSDNAISLGESILLKKGFSTSEVTSIVNRITSAMTVNENIKSKDKYFLAACNKEVRKGNSPAVAVHKSTGGALAVRDIQVKVKAAAAVEEKQDLPAAEVLEKIKLTAPMELYEVIMSVDNDKNIQKALQFFSSDIVKKEILSSHYLAAFKKKYPEITIC